MPDDLSATLAAKAAKLQAEHPDMDDDTRYHDDLYGWSRDQAEVLRALKNRPGLPNALDLDHVIEEIESVGGSQLSAAQSYLRLILVHLVKVASSRNEEPKGYWRAEIVGFHADLLARYSPSVRQHIDLPTLWRRALDQAELALESYGDVPATGLRAGCPFELEDLISDPLDIGRLVSRLKDSG